MIRKFIISTSQMAGAVTARAITSLVLNKLVALFYGPMGITLLAHLQNLMSIVIHLPNDGINRGSISLFQHSSPEEKVAILKRVLWYNFLLALILSIMIFFGKDYFWSKFYPVTMGAALPLTFLISVILITFYFTLLSVFQADRKFLKHSLANIIASVVVLAGGLFAVYYLEVGQFLQVYLIAQALGLLVVSFFFFSEYSSIIKIRTSNIKLNITRPLLDFLIMAIAVWLFTFMTDFIIRTFAIDQFGYEHTGEWQSVVKFSDQLKAVFVATSGAVFFSEISARLNSHSALTEYLSKTLKLVLPIILVGLIIIYLIRVPVIHILYSNEFLGGEIFFSYQLAGDFFAMASYFFVYIIMVRRRVMAFIIIQALSGTLYILLVFGFVNYFDLKGIVMAHLIRYIFFFIISVYYTRRLLVHER